MTRTEQNSPDPTEPPVLVAHEPVMSARVVELLAPALSQPGAICVDATLGLGGHAEAILRSSPNPILVGIDRDPHALALATARLAPFGARFIARSATFDQIAEVLADLGRQRAHAVLFDLGISSMQIDVPARGFTYRTDAPLDMRMNPAEPLTAADVLNEYETERLTAVLRDYGQERYARRIARAVVAERDREPFTTSARLVALLHRVIPLSSQRGGHPAKRTFQALRIEVNQELQVLHAALPTAIDSLALHGRVAVLSYHSLEDRMVKKVLVEGSRSSTPADLPVELPQHAAYLALLTRGAEVPGQQEVQRNPRAASARLRAAERIRPSKGGNG